MLSISYNLVRTRSVHRHSIKFQYSSTLNSESFYDDLLSITFLASKIEFEIEVEVEIEIDVKERSSIEEFSSLKIIFSSNDIVTDTYSTS